MVVSTWPAAAVTLKQTLPKKKTLWIGHRVLSPVSLRQLEAYPQGHLHLAGGSGSIGLGDGISDYSKQRVTCLGSWVRRKRVAGDQVADIGRIRSRVLE